MSQKVSLFDLDSTLYKGKKGYVILDFPYFLYSRGHFEERYIGNLEDLLDKYGKGLMLRQDFALKVIEVYYKGLEGQSVCEVEEEAKNFWRENSESAWYPYTLPLIAKMGRCTRTILVSGSPLEVLQHMPTWNDFNEKYATFGKVENGRYTGEWCVEYATDEAKQKLVESMTFDPDVSFAFGDSESDIPLLNAVAAQSAFLFCKDVSILKKKKTDLYDIAMSKGWKILHYDSDVLDTIGARLQEVFGEDNQS